MNTLISRIKAVETTVAAILLTAIVVLVFFAALFRWFGFPVAWSIDIAQLFFGWVVFLGADVALKNDAHIGVDMILIRLPFKARRNLMIVIYCAIMVFLALITYHGFNLVVDNRERLFNTLPVSYSFATASVPTGCLLMIVTVIWKLKNLAASKNPTLQENVTAW